MGCKKVARTSGTGYKSVNRVFCCCRRVLYRMGCKKVARTSGTGYKSVNRVFLLLQVSRALPFLLRHVSCDSCFFLFHGSCRRRSFFHFLSGTISRTCTSWTPSSPGNRFGPRLTFDGSCWSRSFRYFSVRYSMEDGIGQRREATCIWDHVSCLQFGPGLAFAR